MPFPDRSTLGPEGVLPSPRSDRSGWDRAIAELAARQHGVVSRAQLLAAGPTRAAIEHRLRAGRLHRLHPGVYAVGHRVVGPRGWWMAAVLGGGPGAVLSHRSAAALRGLVDGAPRVVDVLVLRTGTRVRGVRQHRVRQVHADDRSVVDGIPCTSVSRTLVDLARSESERTLDRALRRSVALQVFDRFAIEAVLRRRLRGSVALRAALTFVAADHAANREMKAEMELRFVELLRRHGFVLPQTNATIRTRKRDWEVDAYWPDLRLVIELDGWETHWDRESFRRDHQRGVDVRAMGIEVIRLAWDQVVRDEPGTVALLDGIVPRVAGPAGTHPQ